MSCSRIMIVLVALSSCLGCELRSNRAESIAKPDTVLVVLRPTQAVIRELGNAVVIAKETRISSRLGSVDRWHKAQFVNEQRGWACTYKSIYRTSDGGSSWERLSFQALELSRISSIFFIDELRGWLAVTKQEHTDRYGLGNSSKIFATKDGGDTWIEQANFPDEVRIQDVSFLNASRGFATGARIIDQPINHGPPYEELLVLSTTDGGSVWTDNSESLKNAIKNERGATSDSGLSLHSPSPTETLLLTANGRIVQTPDHGNTWNTIVKFQSENANGISSSMAYYKLVFDPEQKLRVLGGAIGDEGYWGNLVVNAENNSWINYELMRTPILDAVFVSNNEVLACGFETPAADEKRSPSTMGILLHSLDGGKSWRPIYRSKVKESFISLTKIGDNDLYALSDAGTFLRFAFKK